MTRPALNPAAITRRLTTAGLRYVHSHRLGAGVRVWLIETEGPELTAAMTTAREVLTGAGFDVAAAYGYAGALLVTLPAGELTIADRAAARVTCADCDQVGGSHALDCDRPRAAVVEAAPRRRLGTRTEQTAEVRASFRPAYALELEAEAAVALPADSKAGRLTDAQAACLYGFRELAAHALADLDALARWRDGRVAFGTAWRDGARYGGTSTGRGLGAGEIGERPDVHLSFELLEAASRRLALLDPQLRIELREARLDYSLTLAGFVTRTETPAERTARVEAGRRLSLLLLAALELVTKPARKRRAVVEAPVVELEVEPAPVELELEQVAAAHAAAASYETDRARRRSTAPDPAELELEAAARRRQLDAAIVEDMLAGDLEPYVDETPPRPASAPRRPRRAAVVLPARQLALMPLTADEDGAQLDLFEAVAQAELELAGGAR